MKKWITMMMALSIALTLSAGSALAGNPVAMENSKACDKANQKGKDHANGHSVVGSCPSDDVPPPPPAPAPTPTGGEDTTSTTDTTAETNQPSATCDGSDPFNPACL